MTEQASAATAHRSEVLEQPLFFPAGDETLFGVLTTPALPQGDLGVLLLHGGPMNFTAHRNAVWGATAHDLATIGCRVLRMDYHGTGDSSGILQDRSVEGQSLLDVLSGVEVLRARGARRFVIAGTCWGGFLAFVAADQIADLAALCLVAPPLHLFAKEYVHPNAKTPNRRSSVVGTARRLLTPAMLRLILTDARYRTWLLHRSRRRIERIRARWTGGKVSRPRAPAASTSGNVLARRLETLRRLRERDLPVHVLYGSDDRGLIDFTEETDNVVLRYLQDWLSFDVADGELHGLTTLHAQTSVREAIVGWVSAVL